MLPISADAAERQAAYEEAVLRPLLGPQYIHRGRPCQLQPEFARSLSEQVEGIYRSLSFQACLLPDHTVFRQSPERASLHMDRSAEKSNRSATLLEASHASSSPEPCGNHKEPCEAVDAGTLSVEIKPKCGFLPTSAYIKPEQDIKRRVPRFQLHQCLKLEQVAPLGSQKLSCLAIPELHLSVTL